jgi:Arc/MetJ-type ribon-helix-helix transcriptional regulator
VESRLRDEDTKVETGIATHVEASSLPEPSLRIPPSLIAKRTKTLGGESLENAPDIIKLAKAWATQMRLEGDKPEMLEQILDPNYQLDLSGSHKDVRHHFRLFMKAKLPELESDEVGLTSNEIARLNALFGRIETPEGHDYKAQPKSVREVCLDKGFFVPQRQAEILSALEKVANYLQIDRVMDIKNDPDDNMDTLEKFAREAEFSQEEIDALKQLITFDEDGKYKSRSDALRSALARVQRLLVEKKLTSHPATPGLRMLTNSAFGVKTLDDVYYKMHERDQSIKKTDVQATMHDGMLQLLQK